MWLLHEPAVSGASVASFGAVKLVRDDGRGDVAALAHGLGPDDCAHATCSWWVGADQGQVAIVAEQHATGEEEAAIEQVWLGVPLDAKLGFIGLWSAEHVFVELSDAGPLWAVRPVRCGEQLRLEPYMRIPDSIARPEHGGEHFDRLQWLVGQTAAPDSGTGSGTSSGAGPGSGTARGEGFGRFTVAPVDPRGGDPLPVRSSWIGAHAVVSASASAIAASTCRALNLPLP